MDAHRHKSFRAPGNRVGSIPHTSLPPRDQHYPAGRPSAKDEGGRRGDRDNPVHEPPPPQGISVLDVGVVQGRGRPRATARLVNPQEDHSRALHAVSPSTTPGVEHPLFVEPFPVEDSVPMENDIKWPSLPPPPALPPPPSYSSPPTTP